MRPSGCPVISAGSTDSTPVSLTNVKSAGGNCTRSTAHATPPSAADNQQQRKPRATDMQHSLPDNRRHRPTYNLTLTALAMPRCDIDNALTNRFVHARISNTSATNRPRRSTGRASWCSFAHRCGATSICRGLPGSPGAAGVERIICTGPAKLDRKIARDGADAVEIEIHRTLPPVLDKLRGDGYRLVGLEQTTNSRNLHDYRFARRTALVIGNERTGLTDDIWRCSTTWSRSRCGACRTATTWRRRRRWPCTNIAGSFPAG